MSSTSEGRQAVTRAGADVVAGATPWIKSVGGVIGIRAANLVATILVARVLGPEGRGLIAAAVLWPSFVGSIASVINTHTTTYFASRFGAAGFRACVTLALLNGALLFVGALGVNWLVLSRVQGQVFGAANLYAVSLPLSLMASVFVGELLAEGRIGPYWFSKIASAGVHMVVIAILATTGGLTVTSYILATLVAVPVVIVVAAAGRPWTRLRLSIPDRELARNVIAFGGKNLMVAVPHQVNSRMDQLLMTMLVAPAVLGEYALAVTWASLLGVFGMGFTTVVLSHSARVNADAPDEMEAALRKVRRAALLLAASGIVIMALAPLLITRIFGSDFAGAVGPAMVLCLAGVLFNAKLLLQDFARGLGHAALPAMPELAGVVLTLPLLLHFLPSYGGMAAAVISLISYTVVLGLLVAQSVRHVPNVSFAAFIPRSDDFRALLELALGIPATLRARLKYKR